MSEALVFLSGKRTGFGSFGGTLSNVHPTVLATTAAQAAIQQANVEPSNFQHVILGSLLSSSVDYLYIPRHVGLKSGIPLEVPALGINRLCGSGFQVVIEAYHQMLAGDTQVALVGGVENMSMAPYLLPRARWGHRMGHTEVTDLLMGALTDSYSNTPMAITAENLAKKYNLTREESDAFALRSQTRFAQAESEGKFDEERVEVKISSKKGEILFSTDEHARPNADIESLSKLKPVFLKDGVVTAGNASGIVDGAAMMVVSTESYAESQKIQPLGRLVAYGISGCDPDIMGIGPVPAIKRALKKANLSIEDLDLIEVNEAFAPQILAVIKELELPEEKLNVNGGAIALGHPLAATGTRITMHLLYELRRRGLKKGLVSACIGGGQGIALIVEAY
ncbi:MAG: acetyl-CoA C-acyltransferase [Bdellovibrionaceae bacterium]|nr:acetyl-CoA C-acyltransferase [Pseudobdellovibrionaceae bacterium]